MPNRPSDNRTLPIKSIMTREVVYVYPHVLIFDAIRLLPKYQISGMPVVDEEMNLVGILSEKDVLRILTTDKVNYEGTVADYMTRSVVSFNEDTSATEVSQFFQRNPIRRVPVTKDGKLIGVVSRRDIINLILEAKSNFSHYRFS